MFIFPMWIAPKIPTDCDLPPTLYAMLNSIVNFGKDEKTKIRDLAKEGRTTIFDFDYQLSDKVNKAEFEEMILNHFLMRRLGYETYTSWHIAFENKIKEIMPIYNKLFDAIDGWNILQDGEVVTRTTDTINTDTTTSTNDINTTSNATNISDRRSSDTPQNQLADVRNGKYVTNYDYDTDTNSSSTNTSGTNDSESNGTRKETENISRTPADKINIYKQFIESIQSIYSMIYKELDCLFYQLV